MDVVGVEVAAAVDASKGESEPIRRESLYEMVEDDGDGFGQVNVGDDTYHEL